MIIICLKYLAFFPLHHYLVTCTVIACWMELLLLLLLLLLLQGSLGRYVTGEGTDHRVALRRPTHVDGGRGEGTGSWNLTPANTRHHGIAPVGTSSLTANGVHRGGVNVPNLGVG